MYYSKIEAAAVVDLRNPTANETVPKVKTILFGLLVLLLALPFFVARLFLWGVVRDVRRVAKFGGIIGHAATEALRDR